MSKHIKLTTGVDVPASAEHFRRDLQAVLASADADPLKVKIAIDENSIASAMQQLKKFAESTNMLSFGSGKGGGTKAATTEVVSSLENIDTKAQGVAQNVGTSFNTMTNNITTSIASASASIDTLISEMFQRVQSLKLPSADIQQVPLLPEYGSIPSYMQNIDLYPVIDQSNKLSISMLKAVESYEKFLALPAPSISLIDGLGIEDFTREALQAYNVIEVLIKAMQQKIPTGILEEIPGVTFVDIADGAQQATLAIEQTSQSLRDMGDGTASVNNASQSINKMGSEAISTQYKVENLFRAVRGFDNKWFSKDGLKFNGDDGDKKLADYIQRLEEYQERIKGISFDYENGKMVAKRGDTYLEQKEIDELISRYNELNTLRRVGVRNQNTSNKSAASIEREREALQNLNVELSRYIAENKGLMTSRQLDAFNKLYNSTKAGTIGLKEAKDAFARLKQEVNDSAGVVQKFFNQFKTSIISRLSTGAITAGFAALRKAVHEVYENIIQLDKAITDLQIATGGSRQQTAELVKEYSKLGNELGATTVEVAQAADEWLRQGYSAQESEELIRQSMILSKLGQIESSEATVALTSAINGYGKSVGDAAGIVDMLTAVDMEAAASAGGLAIAMSRTATGARTAGVDMQTLIGWIAKVKEVTQDSDEAVGTFFKTMVARMGNIKSGFLVDPETDEDLSDVESALSGVGIKLRDSKAEFRDLQDVLDEVGQKWNTYSSVQQRAIAKAFGGTRQQEKFLVLMENYKDAMRLAGVAANSSGTAMTKFNNAYLKSYEAAKNSLKASTESFSQSLVNTDGIIGAVNALNLLVQVLNKLNEVGANGFITPIVAGLAIAIPKAISFSSAVNTVQSSLSPLLGTITTATSGTMEYAEAIDGIAAALQGQSKAVQSAILSSDALRDTEAATLITQRMRAGASDEVTASIIKAVAAQNLQNTALTESEVSTVNAIISEQAYALATGKLTEAQFANILAQHGIVNEEAQVAIGAVAATGAFNAETVAVGKLSAALTALKASGGLAVLAITAIVALLYGAYKLFDKNTKSVEDYAAAVKDLENSIDSNKDMIESNIKTIKDNTDKIIEYKNNASSLTSEEQRRLQALQQQNTELKAQNVIMESQNKLAEQSLAIEQEKLKLRATKGGFKSWYDPDTGEAYGKFYSLLISIGELVKKPLNFEPNAPTLDNALNYNIDSYLLKIKEYAELQEKVSNGSATEQEKNKYQELEIEIGNTSAALNNLMAIYISMGTVGADEVAKITAATMTGIERIQHLKDLISTVFDGKNITANKLMELYGSNSDIKNWIDAMIRVGDIDITGGSNPLGLDAEDLTTFISIFNGIATSSEKATEETNNFADSLSTINSAQSGLKTIQQAFQDIQSNGKVSFSTINSISDALKDVKIDSSNIERWSKVLSTATSNSAEFKSALTEMTYEYVKAKIGVDKLASSDENYIRLMLEEVGVANADAIAHNMVAQATAEVAIKNAAATGTIEEIKASLNGEAAQSAMTQKALFDLVAQEVVFNNNNLDVSQKIEALQAYAIQAGLTSAAVASVLSAEGVDSAATKAYRESLEAQGLSKAEISDRLRHKNGSEEFKKYQQQALAESATDLSEQIQNKYKYDVVYNGNGGGSGGGSSGGSSSGGGGSSTSALDNYTKSVDKKQKKLELSYKRGEMSAKDYFKALEIIYKDGYDGLKKAIENGEFSDSDEEELLDAETGMLDKLQGAHRDSYEEEKKLQDHYLKMNYITEEQYFAELTRLYLTYYAGREEYSEEAQQAEEELYEKGTAIVEKWANAAVDAVNAVSSAMQSMASAATDLLQGLIDANEHSFDRYYKNLQHQLKMNYITEAEYNDKLDKLYKRYFKDRYIYLDQYQQYEEEVYQAEQQALQDAASATEDIHGKVVDMIRDELEEQKDAIDETKDAYLELIDIRRQALNEQKEQEDYEKEHAEKLAAVAELQRQLNALANDTSAEGVRKYKETLNSLHDAQEDLYDFEREHAYDSLEKQLDDQEAALEESASARSEQIDKLLEDNEWLVSEAWRRLIGMPEETYQQLIEHSKKYSTSIKDDITEAWNTAYEAMKRYYDGVNTEARYAHITGRIGEKGMTDEEALQDDVTAGIKNVAEYTNVFVKAIAAFASAGASLVSSFASILNTVFPNPLTSLLATGAGGMASAVSGFGSIATGLTGFFGGLASGSNSVSATGIYRTDEFGEELKMLHTADGNYTMLTKGSKVFTARATERLAKVLEHPELLTGGLTQDVISNIAKTATPASSTVDASTQNITLQQGPFNISGANPDEIADKIKGTVANYTIDIMRKNARDKGRTRPVKTVY